MIFKGYQKGKSQGEKQMRSMQVVVQFVCYICITRFNTYMRLLTPSVCFRVALVLQSFETDNDNFNLHIWYNLTYNEGSNDGPSTLLQVPGLVNLVRRNNYVLERSSSLHLQYAIFHCVLRNKSV